MTRDSMVFYRSFLASIKLLPKKYQLSFFIALFDYALDGTEPNNLPGGAMALFNALKPQIDANNRKFENGCKGGRPKKNQDETKPKPNNNHRFSNKKPNENVNENVNGDGNVSGLQANSDAPPPEEKFLFFADID